jgi:hypothetical protein
MGTVFGIKHQGMVIPIRLVLCLVTCSLERVTATRLGAGQSGVRNPAEAREGSLLQNIQDQPRGQSASGTVVLSRR